MAAAPAVFLFGSAAHGGHRLAIWERQIWKGLCVVLSDKPAFVRTPNHQSEKTLISIFKTLLSSGFYTLLRGPLSASNSGAHYPVKSVKWCLGYSILSCLLDPLCHIQSQVLDYPFSVLLPDSVKHVETMVKHPILKILMEGYSHINRSPPWTSSHVSGWFGWCGCWRLWWIRCRGHRGHLPITNQHLQKNITWESFKCRFSKISLGLLKKLLKGEWGLCKTDVKKWMNMVWMLRHKSLGGKKGALCIDPCTNTPIRCQKSPDMAPLAEMTIHKHSRQFDIWHQAPGKQ